MKQLIPIRAETYQGVVKQTVNARDLHAFMEVRRDFSNWIKARIEQYGFVKDEDFIMLYLAKTGEIKERGKANAIEYRLTLDMAKELSMVEKTRKGQEARRYFLKCEKIALQTLQQQASIPWQKIRQYAKIDYRRLICVLDALELVAATAFEEGCAIGADHKEQYGLVKERVTVVARLLPRTQPPAMPLEGRASAI